MENWTLRHTLKNLTIPYSCPNSIVYRLASPVADHYFFINDDDAKTTSLKFAEYKYKSIKDVLTGQQLKAESIPLESHSGKWIRCEKLP
jgi:beta-galactosidase